LREELKLRVFDNRLLRIIFRLKEDKLTGVWRKLHKEELTDTYSSPNTIRVIKSRRSAGQVLSREELQTGCGGETSE
jgi:hypothetical protein